MILEIENYSKSTKKRFSNVTLTFSKCKKDKIPNRYKERQHALLFCKNCFLSSAFSNIVTTVKSLNFNIYQIYFLHYRILEATFFET